MTAIEIENAEASRTLSPLKAVRAHCLGCCNGSSHEVSLCVSKSCPLWLFRFGHKPTPDEIEAVADVAVHPGEAVTSQAELHRYSALRAVRLRCVECSGGSVRAVAGCQASDCSLHEHRLRGGSKKLTGEALEAARTRLATAAFVV